MSKYGNRKTHLLVTQKNRMLVKSLWRKMRCRSISAPIAISTGLAISGQALAEITLEEVVVTARKVDESLDTVPIAINVLSGANARELGINTPQEMVAISPGSLQFSSSPERGAISIRGVASGDESATGNAGVVVMVDDEVLSRDFFKSAPGFDIDRVEVLRGPQGTTQGRNSVGGSVNTITNRPGNDRDGYIRTEVTEHLNSTLEGASNFTLSENIYARLSGYYQHREGFFKEVDTGRETDTGDAYGFRAQLLHTTDKTDVLAKVSYTNEEYDNIAPRKYRIPSDQPIVPDSFFPYGPVNDTFEPSDDYTVNNNESAGYFYDREVFAASLEISHELSENINLTSLTTYRSGSSDIFTGFFGTDYRVSEDNSSDDGTIFSQELRIDNAGEESPLAYVAGLYYLEDEHDRVESVPIFFDSFLETLPRTFEKADVTSKAVFADLNYELTSNTTIGLGVRYTVDEQSYQVNNTATGPLSFIFLSDVDGDGNGIPVIADGTDDWSKTTYKVSLDHTFDNGNLIWASYATGYKSGGFNPKPINTESLARFSYAPENVSTYELGVKSKWMADRVRLNLAWFDSTYEDIQRDFFDPATSAASFVANIGEAEIAGLEMETSALLTDNFRIALSGAYYYDHHFTDAESEELIGNELANVPEWTLRFDATYSLDLTSGAEMLFSGYYQTSADTYDDDQENDVALPALREGIDDVGLTSSYTTPGGGLTVSLFVRNLLDEARVARYGPILPFLTARALTLEPGREAGVSINYEF